MTDEATVELENQDNNENAFIEKANLNAPNFNFTAKRAQKTDGSLHKQFTSPKG